jgi:hypothetical protein
VKIKNLFYIGLIAVILVSFLSCDLTKAQDPIEETAKVDLTRLTAFCPGTSFSGHNGSGSFSCSSQTASVGGMCGGGTLTFEISGFYWVSGKIKSVGFGGGSFKTSLFSITSTSSEEIFTGLGIGDCYLSGSGSCMGGGVIVKDLIFEKY